MSRKGRRDRKHGRSSKARTEPSGLVAGARQQANAAGSRHSRPQWASVAHAATQGRPGVVPSQEAFLPEGWLDLRPSLNDVGEGPDVCVRRGELILGWVAAGLAAIDEADRSDLSPPTMPGCWEGDVVEVHRWAVHAVDATTQRAASEARAWGLTLAQIPRSEAGMDPDSMRRVLACVCDHDECDPEMLEIAWRVANAALEVTAADIGWIAPGQACSDYLARVGAADVVQMDLVGADDATRAACARLGLDLDWRRHKPVNTADMVFGDDGDLLAVRPQRPGRSSRRPDHDTLVAFMQEQPAGVTAKEVSNHFGISYGSARRSVDDLNPEFVYRGVPDRCVVHRSDGETVTWRITSDRAEIDRRFADHHQIGREFDIVYRVGRGAVVAGTKMVQRW